MKIAFLHFHLKRGGVTTVINQQIKAISASCETIAISGPPQENEICLTDHFHVDGIGYDETSTSIYHPDKLAESILEKICAKWPGGCDLIHVHNPLLSKNRQFLSIIQALLQSGQTLLLQVHDFAEDGRPLFYFQEEYPADCHYCVINSRDFRILSKSGLSAKGLHLLPNMITPLQDSCKKTIAGNYILYPVRAIRRKNIGEAILLSQYMPGECSLFITLPPNSAEDKRSYSAWKQFVKKNELSIEFEKGFSFNFSSLVSSATGLITTSISEGFGFSFLEPWTAGKQLWGRRIPEICNDFDKNGIDLSHLYTFLSVPLDWIDKHSFYIKWSECLIETTNLFGLSKDLYKPEEQFDSIIKKGTIDFGLLDEKTQRQVINKIMHDPSFAADLLDLNPFMASIGTTIEDVLITKNKNAVMRYYGMEHYAETLLNLYQKVTSVPVSHQIDKNSLLSGYLRPEDFSLLKWYRYDHYR